MDQLILLLQILNTTFESKNLIFNTQTLQQTLMMQQQPPLIVKKNAKFQKVNDSVDKAN